MSTKYQIIEHINAGKSAIYANSIEPDKKYLVVPKTKLNEVYGNFFINENLLFVNEWSHEVINALIKNTTLYQKLKNQPDTNKYRAFYYDNLKMPTDLILPTIAEVAGDAKIKVAAETLSLDARTYYQKEIKQQLCYIFPY